MFTIESQSNFFENSLMVPSPPVTMTSTTGRREGINDEITLDIMKNEVYYYYSKRKWLDSWFGTSEEYGYLYKRKESKGMF